MNIKKKYLTLVSLLTIAVPMTGCLKVFKSDLKQGNHVEQQAVNELRVGMTKMEVQNIMGTPALVPVINTNRWDYYYKYEPGTENKQKPKEKSLSLFFKDDRLQYSTGDWRPSNLPHRQR